MKERWSLSKERVISEEDGLDCTNANTTTAPRSKNETACDKIFRRSIKLLALIFYLELILFLGWAGTEWFLMPYFAPSTKLTNGSTNGLTTTLSPNEFFTDSTDSLINDALDRGTTAFRGDEATLGSEYKPKMELISSWKTTDEDLASLGATATKPLNNFVDSKHLLINDALDRRTTAFRGDEAILQSEYKPNVESFSSWKTTDEDLASLGATTTKPLNNFVDSKHLLVDNALDRGTMAFEEDNHVPGDEDGATTEVDYRKEFDEDAASLEATTSRERDSVEILERQFSFPWVIYRKQNADSRENGDESGEISRESNRERFDLPNQSDKSNYSDETVQERSRSNFTSVVFRYVIVVPLPSVNFQRWTNDSQEGSSNSQELVAKAFDRDDINNDDDVEEDEKSIDSTSFASKIFKDENCLELGEETVSEQDETISRDWMEPSVVPKSLDIVEGFDDSSDKLELSSSKEESMFAPMDRTTSPLESDVECLPMFGWGRLPIVRCSPKKGSFEGDLPEEWSEVRNYYMAGNGRKFESLYDALQASLEERDYLAVAEDGKIGFIYDSSLAPPEGRDYLTMDDDDKFGSIYDPFHASSEGKDYLTMEDDDKFDFID